MSVCASFRRKPALQLSIDQFLQSLYFFTPLYSAHAAVCLHSTYLYHHLPSLCSFFGPKLYCFPFIIGFFLHITAEDQDATKLYYTGSI